MKWISIQTRQSGALLCAMLACHAQAATPPPLQAAADSIRSEDLLRHIKVLSSDEFEGRGPGTRGEEVTIRYLVEQYKKIGLNPGHPEGGFIQKVPLMGVTAESTATLRIGEKTVALSLPGEAIATSLQFEPVTTVTDSDVVFVGYGIEAPEYGWDDYKDVDVRGKTIVMLVNDPSIPDRNDPSKPDDRMFKGRAMTYYGRWTYKYEIAAKKGAAAALIVHETGPAGYPYFVLVASHARENFDLQSADRNASRVPVQGWLTETKARELCTITGHNFDSLKQAALSKDFRPLPLGARANFEIKNRLREVASQNVIGKVEGSDPILKNEYVVFTAHWDHIGRNEKLAGDQIFNGALDNASGTAGLLELAKAFVRLKPAPKRTVIFLAVTAEEKGLLGAKYYVEHPLYPLERTLANLNMDGINPWGRTRDVEVIGHGNSTLEDLLGEAASGQGREIKPDSGPEKGRYFRSDHFEFAKLGVPALYLKSGVDYVGKSAGFGQRKTDEFTERDYHKVTDEIKPDWDMSGGVEDLQLLLEVGWRVAEASQWPEWKQGSEFKARREESLKAAAGR
jgi:Zn-dependent M28 family amino/carboxypeptidase